MRKALFAQVIGLLFLLAFSLCVPRLEVCGSTVIRVLHVSTFLHDEVQQIVTIAGSSSLFAVTEVRLHDFNQGDPGDLEQYDVIVFGISNRYEGQSPSIHDAFYTPYDGIITRIPELKDYVQQGGGIVWTHDSLEFGTDYGPDAEQPAGVDYDPQNPGTSVTNTAVVVNDHQVLHSPFEIAGVGSTFPILGTHATGGIVTTATLVLRFRDIPISDSNHYLTVNEYGLGRVAVVELGCDSFIGYYGNVNNWPSLTESEVFVNTLYWAGSSRSPAMSSTSVSCSPNPASASSPVTCTATVSGFNPAGTVTWSASSSTGSFTQSVCTLSSGQCSTTYTDTSAGTVTITASYGGDLTNDPSSGSATLTYLRTSPAGFNLHWDSPYYAVTAGKWTLFTIYLDYSPGFEGVVTLSFQGLPAGCTGEFDIAEARPPSVTYRTLNVTTPSALNNGTYTFTVTGESGDVSQTIPVTLTVGTGEITGVVYRDNNGNGVRDPGEPVVSGAFVGYYAMQQSYLSLYQTSVTADSSGEFTLVNFPFNYDNQINAGALGLTGAYIRMNILSQPETTLNIGLSTPPASGWKTCTQFSIATPISVSFSQYLVPCIKAYNLLNPLNQINVDSMENLPPANLYMITQSSSANQAEFTRALSHYLGMTAHDRFNLAVVFIVEFPILPTINALFNTNLQGPVTFALPPLGIFTNAHLDMTPNGCLNLALTFSKPSNFEQNKAIIDLLNTVARSLIPLIKALVGGEISPSLIRNAIDTVKEAIEYDGDLRLNVITSDLNQLGSLQSYALLDQLDAIDSVATINGIGLKVIKLLSSSACAGGTLGSDVLADAIAILTLLDLDLELLPSCPWVSSLNLKDNPLYQLLRTGISVITGIADPGGTTIIPSFYDSSGSLVLGYNSSSGDIIYCSADGLLIPEAGDWLALLNESASNPVNYTVCLTAMGGSAAVPYNLQIVSSNQNVTAIGYSGMVLGGTSTIIPMSVAPNVTLVQQEYLKPTLSVSETGNVYDFIATGTLSNGSFVPVTEALLVIDGTQYEMTQDDPSTFEVQIPVNLPETTSYFVYMISPNVPGGFASGVLLQEATVGGGSRKCVW